VRAGAWLWRHPDRSPGRRSPPPGAAKGAAGTTSRLSGKCAHRPQRTGPSAKAEDARSAPRLRASPSDPEVRRRNVHGGAALSRDKRLAGCLGRCRDAAAQSRREAALMRALARRADLPDHTHAGELLGALIAGIGQGVLDEQRIAVEAAIRLEFVNIKLVLALDRNKDPGPVSDGSRDTAARSPNRCRELWTPGLLSPPC
jgi:hypothetical protein